MNRKFFSLLLVAVLTASYAQAQFSFGVRGGLNFATVSETDYDQQFDDDEIKPKLKTGIKFGVVGEYAITETFAIQPGIIFAMQGYRRSWSGTYPVIGKAESKERTNINYLQIPVNAVYKLDLDGKTFLLQAGPYFGFALGGKSISKITVGGKTEEKDNDLKFGDQKGEIYGLDLGLGLGVGMQLSAIQIGLEYKFGLVDIGNSVASQFGDTGKAMYNRGLSITATYFFGK